jgi:hypothetical protein
MRPGRQVTGRPTESHEGQLAECRYVRQDQLSTKQQTQAVGSPGGEDRPDRIT